MAQRQLIIRLDEETHRRWKVAAAWRGLPIGTFVQQLVTDEVAKAIAEITESPDSPGKTPVKAIATGPDGLPIIACIGGNDEQHES